MKRVLVTLFAIIVMLGITGCSNDANPIIEENLVSESIISPNEEYIEDDKDKVVLEIKVYQDKDHTIVITATDNTEFFEDKEYTLKYDKDISESDISIEWTTLMGSDKPTKENQKVIATVKISDGDKVVSERKINFAKNAIDIIVESIEQK